VHAETVESLKSNLPAASAERIHKANIAVHRFEAAYYELFHPEVYGTQEQKRIESTLNRVNALVDDNKHKALDFGAGTGNLTDKLLAMGYTVTAIDISAEMCQILQRKHKQSLQTKRLAVINAPIEDARFSMGEFDLICGYSVLHHLPDYEDSLRRLSVFLKKGGVMYLDHEASPFYWKDEPNFLANFVKNAYFHSNPLINSLHFQVIGVKFPSLDYTLSDYWHKKEHPLDHQKIEQVFKTEHFQFFKRTDYHLKGTWVFNPLYPLYRRICRPEMSYWIAKK
jgi:SAM-dependent methyltransferase